MSTPAPASILETHADRFDLVNVGDVSGETHAASIHPQAGCRASMTEEVDDTRLDLPQSFGVDVLVAIVNTTHDPPACTVDISAIGLREFPSTLWC